MVNTATAAPVAGNVAGRVSGVGGSASSLTCNNGESLWLRWAEKNDSGNDHRLVIDDFSFRATAPAVIADGGTTVALFGMTLVGLTHRAGIPSLHA